MRIESVTAHAFGPLADQTLVFSPGMSVVCGGNEAGKSSWHAAVYAALCGRRRAKGRMTKEDQVFAELHRPWDRPETWEVSCILHLDDGRRIELRHDLAGMVHCQATDLALGRDVSEEVMHDGAPDGSRWLGLDRRTFAVTASINQAELLSVLQAADSLQEHLQRAAANANTESTAAQALQCLDAFRREHVGLDRQNSTRPLRQAKNLVATAERNLRQAEQRHEQYLQSAAEAQAYREKAQQAHAELSSREDHAARLDRLAEAAATASSKQQSADRLAERLDRIADDLDREQRRLRRAREADALLEGQVPAETLGGDDTACHVAQALSAWRAAPELVVLTGETAEQITEAIAALPDPPDGDTEVHSQVQAARLEHERAEAVLAEHLRDQPETPEPGPAVAAALAAGPSVLRDLAHRLVVEPPEPPSDLQDALDTARARRRELQALLGEAREQSNAAHHNLREVESANATAHARAAARQEAQAAAVARGAGSAQRWRTALTGASLVALVVASGLAAAHLVPAAAVCGALGVLLLVTTAVTRHRRRDTAGEKSPEPRTETSTEPDLASVRCQVADADAAIARLTDQLAAADRMVAAAEVRQEEYVRVRRAFAAEREKAVSRCKELKVPASPPQLTGLAEDAERIAVARDTEFRWTEKHQRVQDGVRRAEQHLRSALAERGVDGTDQPVDVLLARYEEQCRLHSQQATQANRRSALAAQLDMRRDHESEAERVEQRRAAARNALITAARAANVTASTRDEPDHLDPIVLVAALTGWQEERAAAQKALNEKRNQWRQLQTLLDGTSIADLASTVADLEQQEARVASEAEAARREARSAAADLFREASEAGLLESDVPRLEMLRMEGRQTIDEARSAWQDLAGHAQEAEGAVTERAHNLPSVAEAEEALAAAQRELDRVEELNRTLALTEQFLGNSQERVHRDIAPVLAASLKQWLPKVTGDRYLDAVVDPADLRVQICGSQRIYRQSDRLSRGTAEQVYLLLRIALARHLGNNETCPLLLDDVTVQSDAGRTLRLLELLHELSAEQQIILFAQEQLVADWAGGALTEPADSVITVSPLAPQ